MPSQSILSAADPNDDDDDDDDDGVALELALQPKPATLIKSPRSLHTFWHEYEFGIAGRKPAKFFNSRDRGAIIHKKFFWDFFVNMVNRGRSANDGIDAIYSQYGFKELVSIIIKFLSQYGVFFMPSLIFYLLPFFS